MAYGRWVLTKDYFWKSMLIIALYINLFMNYKCFVNEVIEKMKSVLFDDYSKKL